MNQLQITPVAFTLHGGITRIPQQKWTSVTAVGLGNLTRLMQASAEADGGGTRAGIVIECDPLGTIKGSRYVVTGSDLHHDVDPRILGVPETQVGRVRVRLTIKPDQVTFPAAGSTRNISDWKAGERDAEVSWDGEASMYCLCPAIKWKFSYALRLIPVSESQACLSLLLFPRGLEVVERIQFQGGTVPALARPWDESKGTISAPWLTPSPQSGWGFLPWLVFGPEAAPDMVRTPAHQALAAEFGTLLRTVVDCTCWPASDIEDWLRMAESQVPVNFSRLEKVTEPAAPPILWVDLGIGAPIATGQ